MAIDPSPQATRYLAFEGGGGSGMAYVGALQAFATARFGPGRPGKDFSWDLDGVAGSSVGAITALMVALDYTPEQLAELIVRDGIFSALFAEQVQPGHFGAAATPVSGAAVPLVGYFSKLFEGKRHPADRAPALKAHCCPGAPAPAAGAAPGPAAEQAPGGGLLEAVLDSGTQPALGALLPLAIGPYAKALLSSAFATARDANAKGGSELFDSFSDHMYVALLSDALPEFVAAVAARRGGELGVFAGYIALLQDDLEAWARDELT
ncbi:MAG TPA: patatin-like phospholipase family protein, partial [Allosphingosinicella sp.]|nr:patatin-like phospholipase family protein [Allosphingosinicella sp.]